MGSCVYTIFFIRVKKSLFWEYTISEKLLNRDNDTLEGCIVDSDKFNQNNHNERGNGDREDRKGRGISGRRGKVVRSSESRRSREDGVGNEEASGLGVSRISNLHRDALEGNHLLLVGADGKEFVRDLIDLAGRKRMISVVDGKRDFQGIGLGYYRGGVVASGEDYLVGALEEISKRRFLRTLVLVDVVGEFNIDAFALLDDLIKSDVQVICVVSDMEELDDEAKWKNEDVLLLLKTGMRENYRWGVEFSSMFGES